MKKHFKYLNLLYQYFLESPKNYVIFAIISSFIAFVEFIGISSIVFSLNILLGENNSFIINTFPFLKNFLTNFDPFLIFLIYVLLIIVQSLTQIFNETYFISYMASWRVEKSIQYIKNILNSKFSKQQNLSASDVQTILTRNIGYAVKIRHRTAIFIGDNILAFSYICISILIAPGSTILFIMLGVTYILINKFLTKYRVEYSLKAQENYLESGRLSYEFFSDFRTLLLNKFLNFFKIIETKIDYASNYQRKNDIINIFIRNIHTPLVLFFLVIGIFLSKFFFNQSNSEILVMLLIFYRAQPKIVAVANGFGSIIEDSPVDIIPELKKWKNEGLDTKFLKKDITFDKELIFENVEIRYLNTLILKDINMIFEVKKITSIIGKSGIGKSTILDIICSFKNDYLGKVTIDNQDYEKLNVRSWMKKNCSILRKESGLISGTFENNIAFLEDKPDYKKILNLLQTLDLINLLDDKLQLKTKIDIKGNNLSAGQQQRILLARALYKEPKLLILDEPTSHLDKKTQLLFNKILEKIKGTMTIILVTHRDEILSLSDRIYEIADGKVLRIK